MFNMPVAVRPTSSNVVVTSEALEKAAKEIDRQLNSDRQFPDLCEQLRVASHGMHIILLSILVVMLSSVLFYGSFGESISNIGIGRNHAI